MEIIDICMSRNPNWPFGYYNLEWDYFQVKIWMNLKKITKPVTVKITHGYNDIETPIRGKIHSTSWDNLTQSLLYSWQYSYSPSPLKVSPPIILSYDVLLAHWLTELEEIKSPQ